MSGSTTEINYKKLHISVANSFHRKHSRMKKEHTFTLVGIHVAHKSTHEQSLLMESSLLHLLLEAPKVAAQLSPLTRFVFVRHARATISSSRYADQPFLYCKLQLQLLSEGSFDLNSVLILCIEVILNALRRMDGHGCSNKRAQ